MGPDTQNTVQNTVELTFEISTPYYFPRRVIHIDRDEYRQNQFPTLYCLRQIMHSLAENPTILMGGLETHDVGKHIGWDSVTILIEYPPHPCLPKRG